MQEDPGPGVAVLCAMYPAVIGIWHLSRPSLSAGLQIGKRSKDKIYAGQSGLVLVCLACDVDRGDECSVGWDLRSKKNWGLRMCGLHLN